MTRKLRLYSVFTALIMVCLISVSFYSLPKTAYANSAAPVPPDNSSGIVFKEHEHIQIESEVLDIVVNDDATADITATYIMKNTSDQAISAKTMFLSPVEYGDNQNITVQRNGEDLDFDLEFYGLYYYYDTDVGKTLNDWEDVLASVETRTYPLGDGSGFYEYRIQSTNNNSVHAKYFPNSYYFSISHSLTTFSNGAIEFYNYNYAYGVDDIIVISDQDINFETNGTVIKYEIVDIYDYLFDLACDGAHEEQMRFAEEQFNLYLSNIDKDRNEQFFFFLEFIDKYISSVTYTVDFEPDEEVKLRVSYKYQMGFSGGYRNYATINYFLTPAKYWKDFQNIEINLILNGQYKYLHTSSVPFDMIDEGVYQYVSSDLPDIELSITVDNGSIGFGIISEILHAVVISIIIMVIVSISSTIIIVVCVVKGQDKAIEKMKNQ